MKWMLALGLLCGLISVCIAAMSHGNYSDPNYPGKCVITPEIILSAGESYIYQDVCKKVTCEEESMATLVTCGVVAVPPGCTKVPADPKLGYPKCCKPKIVC